MSSLTNRGRGRGTMAHASKHGGMMQAFGYDASMGVCHWKGHSHLDAFVAGHTEDDARQLILLSQSLGLGIRPG